MCVVPTMYMCQCVCMRVYYTRQAKPKPAFIGINKADVSHFRDATRAIFSNAHCRPEHTAEK